jgi:hypothetical protein
MTKRRLGELLVAEGLLTEEQLRQGLDEQRKSNMFLGEALVKLGFVSEEAIAQTIVQQFSLPFMSAQQYGITVDVLNIFPERMYYEYQFISADKIGKTLVIIGAGLMNHDVLDELERLSGCKVCQYVSTWKDIRAALERHAKDLRKDQGALTDLGTMLLDATPAPIPIPKIPAAPAVPPPAAPRPAPAPVAIPRPAAAPAPVLRPVAPASAPPPSQLAPGLIAAAAAQHAAPAAARPAPPAIGQPRPLSAPVQARAPTAGPPTNRPNQTSQMTRLTALAPGRIPGKSTNPNAPAVQSGEHHAVTQPAPPTAPAAPASPPPAPAPAAAPPSMGKTGLLGLFKKP